MIKYVIPFRLPLFTDGMVWSHLKLYKDSTLWVGLPKSSRLLAGEDLKSTDRWLPEFYCTFYVAFDIFWMMWYNGLLRRGEEERPILNNSIFSSVGWLSFFGWLNIFGWWNIALHCIGEVVMNKPSGEKLFHFSFFEHEHANLEEREMEMIERKKWWTSAPHQLSTVRFQLYTILQLQNTFPQKARSS